MSLNSCGVSKEIARHGRDSRHLLLAIAHPSRLPADRHTGKEGGDTRKRGNLLRPNMNFALHQQRNQ